MTEELLILSPGPQGELDLVQVIGGTSGSDVLVHDVDMDGHADVIVGARNQLRVFPGKGDGRIRPAIPSAASGRKMQDLRMGDVTGDGVDDLLFTSYRDGIQLLEGVGDGTFLLDPLGYGTDCHSAYALADVDRDGRLDVVAGEYHLGAITILPGIADVPTPIEPGVTPAVPLPDLRLVPSPNPFSVATRVRLGLSAPGRASVTVFDLTGRRVRELLREAPMAAGVVELTWDGRTDQGVPTAPGVYFVRLEVGSAHASARVTRLP